MQCSQYVTSHKIIIRSHLPTRALTILVRILNATPVNHVKYILWSVLYILNGIYNDSDAEVGLFVGAWGHKGRPNSTISVTTNVLLRFLHRFQDDEAVSGMKFQASLLARFWRIVL